MFETCSCLRRSLCVHLFRLFQGQPVCATCAALHRLVTLGTVLELTVLRAQSFVTERAGGYNTLTSGWVAPYLSPDSARVVFIQGICSPLWADAHHVLNQLAESEKGLGDCAHVKNEVLARANIKYVVQALSYYALFLF